jgi:hypothetical protein
MFIVFIKLVNFHFLEIKFIYYLLANYDYLDILDIVFMPIIEKVLIII